MNKWISVKDRLPEIGGWYLVTTTEGKVELGHWFFKEGWKRGHKAEVVAWQSLPDAYTV